MPSSSVEKDIGHAVDVLRGGGLVAFPTETVYGLGANALDRKAIARVFEVKQRPPGHPLIVHLGHADELSRWARHIPDYVQALATQFWPGPLTLILKRTRQVPTEVTGGQDTVGLRVPRHPLARLLLQQFGGGIAAPSANRFGRISPTLAEHVRAGFGDELDFILNGGPCELGLESTIVDCSGAEPCVLRPGSIGVPALEAALGKSLGRGAEVVPRVPGSHDSHYAPSIPLFLVPGTKISSQAQALCAQGKRVAVLSRRQAPANTAAHWEIMPATADGYGHRLYARLHALDGAGYDLLLVEEPPLLNEWEAVTDRLQRAACPANG